MVKYGTEVKTENERAVWNILMKFFSNQHTLKKINFFPKQKMVND